MPTAPSARRPAWAHHNEAVYEACSGGHVEILDRLLAVGLGVEDLTLGVR